MDRLLKDAESGPSLQIAAARSRELDQQRLQKLHLAETVNPKDVGHIIIHCMSGKPGTTLFDSQPCSVQWKMARVGPKPVYYGEVTTGVKTYVELETLMNIKDVKDLNKLFQSGEWKSQMKNGNLKVYFGDSTLGEVQRLGSTAFEGR